MNLIIEVQSLNKCNFVQHGLWVHNPSVELCGIDDADDCRQAAIAWLESLEPMPFENVLMEHLDSVGEMIEGTITALKAGESLPFTPYGPIHIALRPISKLSQDGVVTVVDFQ